MGLDRNSSASKSTYVFLLLHIRKKLKHSQQSDTVFDKKFKLLDESIYSLIPFFIFAKDFPIAKEGLPLNLKFIRPIFTLLR